MAEDTEVVVVCGGYADVMAADRPARHDDVTVTPINPRRAFVHRVCPHRTVGGTGAAVVDHQEVLARGMRLMADSVTRIDEMIEA
ncbi:hypothetical protein [Streptomyces pratensis]|uniref:hypothetical protein n=1 Tax=Streptomyces pratensis TaxID=1169025 RepID=UPI003626420A